MFDEYSTYEQLDDRFESYRPFYDHSWAEGLGRVADTIPRFNKIYFDLMVSLKSLSRMFSLMQSTIMVAESYAYGAGLQCLENSETVRLVDHFTARLEQWVAIESPLRADIKKGMFDLAEEVHRKTSGYHLEFPRQKLWDDMVKIEPNEPQHTPKNEFRLAILATVRQSYVGLFFAYEDFVVRCVHEHSGEDTQSNSDKFNKLINRVIGSPLAEQCWFDEKIEDARRVRNSLAHSGGRITKKLINRNHGIYVHDGKLHILPADIHATYSLITPRIEAIVNWASDLAVFGHDVS